MPGFGWDAAAASVKGNLQEAKAGEGEGRDVRPLSLFPRRRRIRAHFRPGKAGCVESTGAQAASGGCVRPVAGVVRVDDLLIVMDPLCGRGRRRALGPVPHLQAAQDLFDDRGVSDQADDLEWSGAAGTDQGKTSRDSPPIRCPHFRIRKRCPGCAGHIPHRRSRQLSFRSGHQHRDGEAQDG